MSQGKSLPARLASDISAATAAEFAMVVPVFLTLMFATINGAIAMSAVNQLHYAAERSARCLSVDVSGACTGDVDTYAKQVYDGPALTGLTFFSDTSACGNQVTGTGQFEIVAGLASTAISISATACYPLI